MVSVLLAAQGLGLFALGRGAVAGLGVHAVVGLAWAIAAGFAQVPELLQPTAYRAGAISAAYVIGVMGVGLGLSVASVGALMRRR